ncbi:hypothetical protein [Rhodoferax sp.]|uniref:hypothetical protein n=1 Tax=Rhodoferax sp. TaxID=50421 RepID=UPI002767E12A|nr:hypothetical protein [Rhodoferax sp.]
MPMLAHRCLLAASLAVLGASSAAAEAFAPPGAKATLHVDYLFESVGKRRSEGGYDPHEWRVKRGVTLVAELAAQPATAMPSLQAIDAAQMAELQGKGQKAQAVATQMAPMMADVGKIMAKCGEDEACLTREAQKMGAAMQGTPQMAAAMNARKDAQELHKPGAPRYQAWRATAQKGSYLIDETAHMSNADPICTSRPRHRCTRNEVRKGAGEIVLPADVTKKNPGAAAGFSAAEVDAGKNTLTVGLPVPMILLPYTETITTDEPEGTHDTPTPKGPQAKLHSFRVSASGGAVHDKPLTVALKGGWRSQSGEQVALLKGEAGNAGKLTVRWRFNVQ